MLNLVDEYLGVVVVKFDEKLLNWFAWKLHDGGAVRSKVIVGWEVMEEIKGFGRLNCCDLRLSETLRFRP